MDILAIAGRLRNVRWIGGGSVAGKTTIARKLAADHGLHLYSCDAMQSEHTRRSNPSDHPLLHDFLAMDMDERWMNRPPEVMLKTFHGFEGEGFNMILEDLLALPEGSPILAEGYKLLPRLVAPLLSLPNQAVWLVPTSQFRRRALDARGSTWDIPQKTSNPERTLDNLLARDRLFTEEVVKQAAALQLRMIEMDGTLSIDAVTIRVAECLALATP